MNFSGYELSRDWFDWCFENPNKVTPNHSALYFFCIEHCNRLGWKEKFGLPTSMAKEAIGIRSYNTYIKTFNDLVDFGFIKLIEKSKNQYSSNIIALSKNNKALNKALDKALIKHDIKHDTKQVESTQQSIDSIDKQLTNKQLTNKQKTNKQKTKELIFPFSDLEFLNLWEQLIAEPKWKKKTNTALQASLNKLGKVSLPLAKEMMLNTISGGWQGLFIPDKKQEKSTMVERVTNYQKIADEFENEIKAEENGKQ